MTTESIDRPRYETIARELLEAMSSGRYPVGTLLPTEAELSEAYSVSRQTIRAAMRELMSLGAISRRKGIGTRVEQRTAPEAGYSQALASLDDLVQLAKATRRDIRSIGTVVMDRRTAAEFGAKPGTGWLMVSYVRSTAGKVSKPIGWSDVYIGDRFSAVADKLASYRGLYSDLIEAQFGTIVAEVKQDVTAIKLPAKLAKILDAAPEAPALKVVRRYLDRKGALLLIAAAIHPGDRFSVSSSLKRSPGRSDVEHSGT